MAKPRQNIIIREREAGKFDVTCGRDTVTLRPNNLHDGANAWTALYTALSAIACALRVPVEIVAQSLSDHRTVNLDTHKQTLPQNNQY
jgi:hypothetical protein